LDNQDTELARKHRAAASTVIGLFIAIILLSIVAYLGKPYFRQQLNPPDLGVRIVVGVLGLGAIVWRRNKFSRMRLQDIGALQGVSGILNTLERTTIQLAFLAAAIATVGFISTLMTGSDSYTYWSAIIAVVVLLYCYPTKSSWRRTVQYFADTRVNQPAEEDTKNAAE
jgi:O-antigen/teichoic acid export membrane protein